VHDGRREERRCGYISVACMDVKTKAREWSSLLLISQTIYGEDYGGIISIEAYYICMREGRLGKRNERVF